jgi:hypothetical protein
MRAGMAHANSCDGDALTASPAVDRVSQSTLLFRAFSKTGRSPMLRQQGRDGHVPASSARAVLDDKLHRPSCALLIQRGLTNNRRISNIPCCHKVFCTSARFHVSDCMLLTRGGGACYPLRGLKARGLVALPISTAVNVLFLEGALGDDHSSQPLLCSTSQ